MRPKPIDKPVCIAFPPSMRFILCLLVLFGLSAPCFAEEQTGAAILAIVNDEVISARDVESRLALVLATTRISDTPEVRAGLKPQILRGLMDEALQRQEATNAGIQVSEADIQDAIRNIETQRGISGGGLLERIDQLGVPREAFTDQVRAQLAWTKMVVKKIRPTIKISEEELERERSKGGVATGSNEVQVEILALPVDKPESEAQVKQLAEKLVAEIRGGAAFESVARELGGAQSQGAIRPFWVGVTQLDPAVASALEGAEPGSVAEPVRTLEGYTLVKLLGRRGVPGSGNVTEVVVKDILLKLKDDAGQQDVEASLAIGREVAKHPGNCSDQGLAGVQDLKDLEITVQFKRDRLDALPQGLQEIATRLAVGEVSEPFASREGIRLFMLCERVEKPAPLADREETYQRLFQQKLELEAQKYLRKLRREATIDVRVSK